MNKFQKDAVYKVIFLALSLMFFSLSFIFFAMVIAVFNLWGLITAILCFIGYLVFWRLARLKYKGYQLKYYFCNKKYNQEIVDVLAKFEGAPQSFIEELRHDTKRRYRYAGYLFSRDSVDRIYKDKEAKNIISKLYTKLYEAIKSKGGFVEFFKEIENLDLDSWEINHYLSTSLISDEFDYLLAKVYILTDYTIYDNGLSEEFTKRNNKMIEDLNEIYSPLLFNFKDELENVLNKLKEIE